MNPNSGMRGMRGPMKSFMRDQSVTKHKIAPSVLSVFLDLQPHTKTSDMIE
jgi:hypothetical protein